MSGLVVAVTVLSALMHAGWNALLKRQSDNQAAGFLVALGAMVLSAMLALATGATHIPHAAWGAIALTGVLEGIYFVSLLRALDALPLSTAYGVSRGMGVLVMWPAAALVLHESTSALATGGVLLLAAGLFSTAQSAPRGPGLAWALVCAMMVGGYPLTYKYALSLGAPPFAIFALSLSGSLVIQCAALGAPRQVRIVRALRAAPTVIALAATLCAASFSIWLFALQYSGAAHDAAVRNVSVLFATLFGWAQGEPRTTRSLVSAAAIAAGAICISL